MTWSKLWFFYFISWVIYFDIWGWLLILVEHCLLCLSDLSIFLLFLWLCLFAVAYCVVAIWLVHHYICFVYLFWFLYDFDFTALIFSFFYLVVLNNIWQNGLSSESLCVRICFEFVLIFWFSNYGCGKSFSWCVCLACLSLFVFFCDSLCLKILFDYFWGNKFWRS